MAKVQAVPSTIRLTLNEEEAEKLLLLLELEVEDDLQEHTRADLAAYSKVYIKLSQLIPDCSLLESAWEAACGQMK